MVAFLTHELSFPPPWRANRDGLIAVGGDLSVERLLLAYRSGIFPWPICEDLLTWFSPDPRALIELDGLHISKSLAKTIRQGTFEVRVNSDFEGVIDGCGESAPDRPSTWITPAIREAYVELHRRGHAHSVEAWKDGALAGGLYGVSINGFFAGESMFTRASNASKVALVHLVERMKSRGMKLLDVQVMNPHLATLGASHIARRAYLKRLEEALAVRTSFV